MHIPEHIDLSKTIQSLENVISSREHLVEAQSDHFNKKCDGLIYNSFTTELKAHLILLNSVQNAMIVDAFPHLTNK